MNPRSPHLARDSAAQRASIRQFTVTPPLLGQLTLLVLGIEFSMRNRGGNFLRSKPLLEDGDKVQAATLQSIKTRWTDGSFCSL